MTKKYNIDCNSPGWKTAWAIYSRVNLKKSIYVPLTISIISFVVCLFSKNEPITLLSYITDLIISIVPNILGFIISGYALMMGLSNSEFIRALKNFKEKDNEYSLFQSLNTTFAIVLGILFFFNYASHFYGNYYKS